MLLLIANSTIRHLLDQSFWLFDTTVHSIWAIDLLALSVAPSVWGWNMVDMRSLLPINLCNSFQNMEVNLVSLLDTMDSGIPWSLMTSFRISHVMPLAVTIVVVGTRCTCDLVGQLWLISNQSYLILGESPSLLIAMAYLVLVDCVAVLSACY